MREVLQHGDQELETAVPVAQQQHHADQVHYPHHGTGKVIGHMEDLRRSRGREEENEDASGANTVLESNTYIYSSTVLKGKVHPKIKNADFSFYL